MDIMKGIKGNLILAARLLQQRREKAQAAENKLKEMESLANNLSFEKNLELERSKANTLAQKKQSFLAKFERLKSKDKEWEEKFSQLEKDLKVTYLTSFSLFFLNIFPFIY